MLNRFKVNRFKLFTIAIEILLILVIYSILILQFPKNQLLTDDELNTLITEKGIDPTLINHIGDSYTVILYDTEIMYDSVTGKGNTGIIAYKSRWNKIKTKPFSFINSESADKVDVKFWSTHPKCFNLIGYIGVEIMNKEIYEAAKSVKVVLDNGLVENAIHSDSPILLLPATKKYFWEKPVIATIEVYNEKGTVISGFYTNMDLYMKAK